MISLNLNMALKEKIKRNTKIAMPSKKLSVKQIDWDKYFGKIRFDEDGLEYQRRLRNEWSK
jgi:hypothetical protein